MLQEVVQEVEEIARDIVGDIHTVLPCKILQYDEKKNLAKVKPIGEFLFHDGEKMEFPEIEDVPVMFPYIIAWDIGIVFPIHKGDEMLLFISEIELDEWRTGAKSESPLKYDLTSAIAIPALIKKPNGLHQRAVKENALILKAKDAEIVVAYPKTGTEITAKVKDKKIKIAEDGIDLISSVGIRLKGKVVMDGDVTIKGNVVIEGSVTAQGCNMV